MSPTFSNMVLVAKSGGESLHAIVRDWYLFSVQFSMHVVGQEHIHV